MIPFNKPCYTGIEDKYVLDAMHSAKMSGDGEYSKRCQVWFEEHLSCCRALLTTSCTHSLEMAALIIGVKEGDEIIMPSFTFVSTANAFALRGAKIVFIDINPETMNIDENLIEAAITSKTKAIVPVHYAGVPCNMETILLIADKYKLFVVEDAAQGMMSDYRGKKLGSIGHIGAYSFHETKNYTSAGEGGLVIINDASLVDNAEIVREKGTNRNKFFRGEVDKYSWVNLGSSYLMNDISAAYLWGQLNKHAEIANVRVALHQRYYEGLLPLKKQGFLDLCLSYDDVLHNGHIFFLKLKNFIERCKLIEFLKDKGISSVFHYVPLHSSMIGKKVGNFFGEDIYTTRESERLLRLPMYFGLKLSEVDFIVEKIFEFYCARA